MAEQNKRKILVAGYSPAQSDIMTAAFMRAGLADEVIPCVNGEELLMSVVSSLSRKQSPRLVIIEVAMPIMNGINGALCMRAIEKGMSREKIPILFFTSKSLEDPFVRAIKFLTPAKYVPLPPNVDIETFRSRVEQVVELLSKGSW